MQINPQQQAAARADSGHILVLAGAGTGKTRTIIARAGHLIEQGQAPHRILLLTFTRRAAREMIARLYRMVGDEAERIPAGTFHHFCLRSMRRMPRHFGLENATVIDRDDQIQLMKLVRGDHLAEGAPLPQAAELVRLSSYARNTAQPLQQYLEAHSEFDAASIQRIGAVARDYTRRKEQNNYLDYDDILFRFAKRLHEDDGVRQRLRGLFDHLLVDEMQDTNPLQWLILEGLRDPARLFCVGDDAQSIYAFRGADFRNVHSFTERVPNAQVMRLERNYRSTQGILDLANWLLDRSPLSYGTRLSAVRRTHSTPCLMDFDTDLDEGRWVVRDIVTRHDEGAAWAEHLIITRTSYAARAVESFLVEKKVPYRFVGGVSLLQAAHVKDLFSLVRAAASHQDELAWARYLTLWPRIGDAIAGRLIGRLQTQTDADRALEVLSDAHRLGPNIVKGVHLLREHWQQPSEAVAKAAHFLAPLLKKRYANWDARRRDIDLLARLAERFRSLLSFLETYTLDPVHTSEAERLEQDDLVVLSTAHGAKGTEARVCYLIRVEPGMYPHMRSLGVEDQEEEERRILYVAMTRAQDELIITRTLRSGGYFRVPRGAQYLLEDLDENLIYRDLHVIDRWEEETITPWDRDLPF